MHIQLEQGEEITVKVEDGTFTIRYSRKVLRVYADLPDTYGRQGIIEK